MSVKDRRSDAMFVVQMAVQDGVTTYQKAVRVIDVTCGLLFPLIFILFNVAYWLTY